MDKRITLALIFAVVVETAGALIWGGRAAARLDEVERRVAAEGAFSERLARIETELDDVRRTLDRIDRALEAERSQ